MDLENFFETHRKVAIAFSGGVDSAYLLYAAITSGADVMAYYVKSQFQPQFEYEDAKRLAKELSASMKVIPLDALSDSNIVRNPENRCYFCKKHIFSAIKEAALQDGYVELLDGTNASDDAGDRPGMKALQELSVYSPLKLCGITKQEVRERSKRAGLFTWDKPAYACLATRIQWGEEITEDKLNRVEKAECYLMSLGFQDMRVRVSKEEARILLRRTQFEKYEALETEIHAELQQYFGRVILDPNGRP